MTCDFAPSRASGVIAAPPSKSVAHRYLIAAAIAEGTCRVKGVPHSEDLAATIDCLAAMGATLTWDGNDVIVQGGIRGKCPTGLLNCRECGTTLRLLLPLCLLGTGEATLTGTEKLLSRPLAAYERICRDRGFLWEQTANAVRVAGQLTAGQYELPGNVSSQYVSGLMYALSCLDGESEILLTTRVESRSYIDLTMNALRLFGGDVAWTGENTLRIMGGGLRSPEELYVEGDWSNAAVWSLLQAFGDPVTITGLTSASKQGDRVIEAYLCALKQGNPTLSVSDCPDLAPVLMAGAAFFNGVTLTDTARLRLKESDRGAAMRDELAKCGVEVIIEENSITVQGGSLRAPTVPLTGHNDHRIVMAASLLLTRLGGRLEGCEAVAKSYPDFFEVLSHSGIEVTHV